MGLFLIISDRGSFASALMMMWYDHYLWSELTCRLSGADIVWALERCDGTKRLLRVDWLAVLIAKVDLSSDRVREFASWFHFVVLDGGSGTCRFAASELKTTINCSRIFID
jgi:hypothetical protein